MIFTIFKHHSPLLSPPLLDMIVFTGFLAIRRNYYTFNVIIIVNYTPFNISFIILIIRLTGNVVIGS
jgi:hypothetical protein